MGPKHTNQSMMRKIKGNVPYEYVASRHYCHLLVDSVATREYLISPIEGVDSIQIIK